MSVLHVTSGDSAAQRIRESGVGGDVLAWRDVLHEGPVPTGLSLDEMSRVRARFLSGCPWGRRYEEELAALRERDAALKLFKRFRAVVLWFEHDLYDQLQLLQILHWFAFRDAAGAELSLICIEQFPGVEGFRGLGQLSAEQVGSLFPGRTPVTREMLEEGRRGWEAFTAERPLALQELARRDASGLPFLRAAMERLLQQYPSTRDGLSRTERQILEAVAEGETALGRIFRTSQIDREERPFMADWPFLLHVMALCAGEQPLLELEDGRGLTREQGPPYGEEFWERRLRQTEAGRTVLSGRSDRSRFQHFDRWIGGVHLEGQRVPWRWGHGTRSIIAQDR